MKFKALLPLLLVFLVSFTPPESERIAIVEITTTYGVMKFKLYNETPQHRDNFIKLVSEGFYDSTLFHRVINEFMIQGGDPQSKNASPTQQLGNGGPGYTIPAEINKNFIHKKGALAAARQGDQVNPEKRSSGSQFYIVQGRKYTASDMERFQQRNIQVRKQQLMNEFFQKPENEAYLKRLKEARQNQDQESLDALIKEVDPLINIEYEQDPIEYLPHHLKAYEELGGTPHLDGGYTVFGEIIEGMDVLDAIANAPTQPGDRPVLDIPITVRVVK